MSNEHYLIGLKYSNDDFYSSLPGEVQFSILRNVTGGISRDLDWAEGFMRRRYEAWEGTLGDQYAILVFIVEGFEDKTDDEGERTVNVTGKLINETYSF